MNIIYNWIVNSMDCYPKQTEESNVVFKVNWGLTGSDESTGIGYGGYINGSIDLTYEVGTPFTPYANLTENQVIGWVQTALGEEKIVKLKVDITKQIAEQMNPPIVKPSLPWLKGA